MIVLEEQITPIHFHYQKMEDIINHGGGEWVQTQEHISAADYQKYADSFNPVDYNPRECARAAKNAGMKYAVMTTKHHDGFCMFDSKYTDYKSTKTPAGRDLIREFVEAFRAEGLKVEFYYSLIDWHHPDYPNVGNHPMYGNEEYSKNLLFGIIT